MSVSYDRCRLFSFIHHATESHVAPIVHRMLEQEIPESVLAVVKPLTASDVSDMQDGHMGDVSVGGFLAVADTLASLPLPSVKDDASDEQKSQAAKVFNRNHQVLQDFVTLMSVSHGSFRKSTSWPSENVEAFLAKCGTNV